ncbi:MAG: bifunctional hydroxymethylpyrimidine kinase/phosphomethylpyrimidine kinase [Victivallaceae bacterium]
MKSDATEFYPAALTIAGSDSGGGAGIQADLRTFAAFGVFGCSAITAVTAQNPQAVSRVDAIPAAGVEAQIKAVLSKIAVRSLKTGMLFNAAIIETVSKALAGKNLVFVLDPVMVSSSGARLLEEDAVSVLADKLMPLADWITPNVPEAELLLGRKIRNNDDALAAVAEFGKRWDCSVILKAGHLEQEGEATDLVYHQDKIYELSSPRVPDSSAAHGTGCTLSSALTAAFALDIPWKKALRMAKGFVYGSLSEYVNIGAGIEAMYPPAESYQGKTSLTRVEN